MLESHDEFIGVEPNVWKGFAGSLVNIPSVGEAVYYFPKGHAQHSTSPPLFSRSVIDKPKILCRVLGVRFLVNSRTDQILATIQLEPILDNLGGLEIEAAPAPTSDDNIFDSFTKKLTWSDKHSNRLLLPKIGAELIFPRLNYGDLKEISIKDVQGSNCNFALYKSKPGVHFLTIGWSNFHTAKKLTEGDSLTFMKNKTTNEYYIGISRRDLDKVSPESVKESAELAAANMPFQVIFYPTAGSAFVVNSELVHNFLSFKITVEHHPDRDPLRGIFPLRMFLPEAMQRYHPLLNMHTFCELDNVTSLQSQNNNNTNASMHLIHNEPTSEPPPVVNESVEENNNNANANIQPPLVKESIEEEHTNNSPSSSFKLFGKNIHVKVPDSFPKQ